MSPTVPNSEASEMAEVVSAYLRDNPHFLDNRPELLSALAITHETGEAVSLIERQVTVLREKQDKLSNQVARLTVTMQEQRDITGKVLEASSVLCRQKGSHAVYKVMSDLFRDSFEASVIKLFFFVEEKPTGDQAGIEMLSPRSKIRWFFTELFNRNKPLCDSLQVEHLEMLFSTDARTVRSTVLIPLKQKKYEGLLAVGSNQRNSCCFGLELDLMAYVAKQTGALLEDTIRQSNPG